MLIAQITDTHIVAKGEHWLNEPSTQTSERLRKAVNYLNQLNPLPDVILLTGDASDTGTKASYHHLKELLAPLRAPFFIIPGNHDSRDELIKAFSKSVYMPKEGFIHYVINDYPVSLIGLDTHVIGKNSGNLCEQRFDWLRKAMNDCHKPALIFMHHPPTKIGYKLFDSMNCSTPQNFEEFIKSQNHLLGIVTGHCHRFYLTTYGNKPCFIAPSIAPMHHFSHSQDEHVTALELQDPAITLHKWHEGRLTSHILSIQDEYVRIDWSVIANQKNGKK